MLCIPDVSYSISRRTINTLNSKDGIHCTNKYLLLLFDKANLMLNFNEQMISLIDHCAVTLPPNTPYSFSYGAICQYLRISMTPKDEDTGNLLFLMTHKHLQRIAIGTQELDTVFPAAETLLTLSSHCFPHASDGNIYGAALISQIILSIYHLQCKDRKAAVLVEEQKLSDQIINFLNENYEQRISLEDLSSRFFHSKYYISHCFHDQVGETITSYLNRLRTERACQLLKSTDKTIDEIVNICGFGSTQNFYVTFKHFCGLTPITFKKNTEKD